MRKDEVKSILLALNSSFDLGFKYPFGNKDLTIKTRELESEGVIIYNSFDSRWYLRTNKILKQLRE
jgi:hypothetical protein